MTPTEQDKQLREKLSTLVHLHHYGFCENIVSRCYKAPQKYWTQECKNRAKQYEDKLVAFITADRKRVALEARIDELGSVQLEYNHLLAQTFRDGQAMTVQERYDHLQAQLTTSKSKE